MTEKSGFYTKKEAKKSKTKRRKEEKRKMNSEYLEFKGKEVLLKEILYIKVSKKNRIEIVSNDGRYEFTSSLKEIGKVLDDRFAECSSSEYVNIDHIISVDKINRGVIMTDKSTHKISFRKLKRFIKKWEKLDN